MDTSEKDIDALQKVWSDKQKVHEMSIPATKRRNRQKVERIITPEQREALDEEYYGFFRGAVGQKTLWTSFNENNEKQKASLSDDNKSAWVPWRTLQLYVSEQSTNQLMRDAKTPSKSLAIVPTKSNMVPFKKFMVDSIVMRSNRDGRHAYIVNMIDIYTRYSWQRSIMLNNQMQYDQRSTVRAVQEILDSIRDKYGADAIKPGAVLQADNGSEYKSGKRKLEDGDSDDEDLDVGYFKREVEQYEPNLRVTYARAYAADQQSLIEHKNKEWRRVARQVLFNKDERAAQDKLGKSDKWFSKWYGRTGRHGRMMSEINAILNSIPSRTLGNISPADFLEALLGEPENATEAQEFKDMVATANATMVREAEKRRKESTAAPLEVGDWVRTVNAKYVKSSLRGNYDKFNPRWSTDVFRVRRRAGGDNYAPYRYQLEQIDVDDPTAPTTSTKAEMKVWYNQSEVQHIPKTVPREAPHDLMVSERPWEDEKITPARKTELESRQRKPKYFKSYPFAEFE
eukprot:COSAG01_NODE_4795_length_4739_cov_16.309267_3_plen_513_part_00